ncbi:MAG: ferredoxin--NADP reductase [Chloroflexota bacterium]
MWEFETALSEVVQRTPDIKSFRFDIGNRDLEYTAGQYFFVTIKVKGQEAVHHFTISSSPTETVLKGYLEFTKRITSSEYSQALDRMKPGDWARLNGPEGSFTLPPRRRDLAFLSGGIGITPLRSMMRFIVDRKLKRDVVLIYGNKSYEDIAFRDELDEMADKHENIRVEHVLSGPDVPPGWKGHKGYITGDLVRQLAPDYQKRVFYVSGPLGMVKSLEEQLTQLGLHKYQVRHDYFPGYD